MATGAITEAESRVMAVVWDLDGAGFDEILTVVGPANAWGASTVRTLIHRLIGKGVLASERRRGRTVYAPRLTREAWLTAEGRGILDRLFDGRLAGALGRLRIVRSGATPLGLLAASYIIFSGFLGMANVRPAPTLTVLAPGLAEAALAVMLGLLATVIAVVCERHLEGRIRRAAA